jgi:hypothetical protein
MVLLRKYTHFQRVDAIEILKQSLILYIRGTCQCIIIDEEKCKIWFCSFWNLRHLFIKYWNFFPKKRLPIP